MRVLAINSDGIAVDQIKVGSQVSLQAAVVSSNCNPDNYPLIVILEVRDSDGITKYLAWQDTTINSDQWLYAGFLWVPEKAGNHTVRAFAISCLTRLGVINQVMSADITVVD